MNVHAPVETDCENALGEPSMQELLASVRRMIAREEAGETAVQEPAPSSEEFVEIDPAHALVESMRQAAESAQACAPVPDVDEEFERIGAFIRGFRQGGAAGEEAGEEPAFAESALLLTERVLEDGSVAASAETVLPAVPVPVQVSAPAVDPLEALVLRALEPALREAVRVQVDRLLPELLERAVRETLRERL